MSSLSEAWKQASTSSKLITVGSSLVVGGYLAWHYYTLYQQKHRKPIASGFIISGAPASGKGTQCERIVKMLGVVHLSTGDMLRAEVAKGSPLGKQADTVMKQGGLVADDLVISIIRERFKEADVQEKGFLLDGFPRTKPQAQALLELGVEVKAFVLLNVEETKILERVTGRRIDPQTGASYHIKFNWPPPSREIEDRLITRSDDTEEAMVKRLKMYNEQSRAMVPIFEDCLIEIDGNGSIDETWEKVKEHLLMITGDE